MATRDEKKHALMTECRNQRRRLSANVDEARALYDASVGADRDVAADLLVEASAAAGTYDLGLLLRGVDLAEVL